MHSIDPGSCWELFAWGLFQQHMYAQLLWAQIPKMFKDCQVISVFLHFEDLQPQKLLMKLTPWCLTQNLTNALTSTKTYTRRYEIFFRIIIVRFKEQQPKSGVDTDTWTNKKGVFFFQSSYIQTFEWIIERWKVGEHCIFN